ncbi:MAG: phosphoribosylglycinamide formyltransferase [Chitinivibrionales bacterium]|nr:phosphoribosylglycinamide formyltransferase [Chitinivibrionales bacterium]
MKRCAVFASGGGSNFQALIDRREAGDLHVELALLVGNNSKAGAFERARTHGIASVHLPPTRFDDPAEYADRLMSTLEEHRIDMIALAGYMKKLPDVTIETFRNRILNVHPALLPAFGGQGMYGRYVHEAVLESGVKVTGVTVHFVDEHYDHGPIILQEPVRVLDNDTPASLAQRVLEAEHAFYWRAVEAVGCDALRVDGNRVYGRV